MRTQKEAEIEEALLEGKRWNVIAKELHVSNRTIAKVSKRMKEVSPSQVFKMFDEGSSPMKVVVETNKDPTEVMEWFKAWLEMNEDWRSWQELSERMTASAVEKDGEKEAKERKARGERDWRDILRD